MNIEFYKEPSGFSWKPHFFKWTAIDEEYANYSGWHKYYLISWLWFSVDILIG